MLRHRSARAQSRKSPRNHRGHKAYRPRLELLEARAMMDADAILHWNDVALEAVSVDHTLSNLKQQAGPAFASRALAMVSASMFDAINSIKGQYEPYLIKVVGVSGANIDAAVGQAAHDTLVSLYSKQKPALDAALTSWLADIPNGKAENLGIALGKTVASAIIKSRVKDGSQLVSDYEYTDAEIGHHQTDPVTFDESGITQVPYGTEWGSVKTFGITKVDPYLPPPPPELDSQEYTDAYNELLELGGDGDNSPTSRTDDQTEIGIFWAYDGTQGLCAPPRLYNQIVQVIAEQEGNTEYENARLFCLVNVAMADAGIVGWACKYNDDFWRPVMGIREGDLDGNPDTVGIPGWTPLGAPASNETFPNNFTPPFPSYVSGHAIFGAAVFQTLTNFYGTDDISFDFTSDEFNGTTTDNQGNTRPEVTRHYDSFSQASQENGDSRIYLGIHWRFDVENGIAAGNHVADAIFDRILEPIKTLPTGNNALAYVQTVIATALRSLEDGVHRQVVLLTPTNASATRYCTTTISVPIASLLRSLPPAARNAVINVLRSIDVSYASRSIDSVLAKLGRR